MNCISKSPDKFKIAAIIFLNAVILGFTMLLYPIGDDWGYYTIPRVNGNLVAASRMIDVIYGLFLGKFPFLFPYLNHVIVVGAHAVSSVLFYLIAKKNLNIKDGVAFVFAVIFTISAGCCATVFSIDALNQSLSLMFGTAGLFLYLNYCKSLVFKLAVYLIFSALSLLSKESGMFFVFIIPFFELLYIPVKDVWKKMAVFYTFGAALGLCYLPFVSFSGAAASVSTILKNTVIHLAFSAVQIDTVSLFGYSKLSMPIVTVVLCIPVLAAAAAGFFKYVIKKDFKVFLLLFVFLLSTFPQNLLSGAQEMNSYPVVFFAMLFFSYLFNNITRKTMYICIIPYIAAALISGSIKFCAMYKLSAACNSMLDKIKQQTLNVEPDKVLIYAENVFNEDSYGVFILSPLGAIGNGYGVRSIYGYDTEVHIEYYHNKKNKTPIKALNSTFIDEADGSFKETLIKKAKTQIKTEQYDLCLILSSNGEITAVVQ